MVYAGSGPLGSKVTQVLTGHIIQAWGVQHWTRIGCPTTVSTVGRLRVTSVTNASTKRNAHYRETTIPKK